MAKCVKDFKAIRVLSMFSGFVNLKNRCLKSLIVLFYKCIEEEGLQSTDYLSLIL